MFDDSKNKSKNEQKQIRNTAMILLAVATVSILLVNGCYVFAQSVGAPMMEFETDDANVTEGTEAVTHFKIRPAEPLPANGTMMMSTGNATDLDITGITPEGVIMAVSNTSAIVTNSSEGLDDFLAQSGIDFVTEEPGVDEEEEQTEEEEEE